MPDRLELWDRLTTLAVKTQEAIDACNAMERTAKDMGEAEKEQSDKSNFVMSGLLHLLLSSQLYKSGVEPNLAEMEEDDEAEDQPTTATVMDRYALFQQDEEARSKTAEELLAELPLGRLFNELEQYEGDPESGQRFREARKNIFVAVHSLIRAGIVPDSDAFELIEDAQKKDELSAQSGLSTLQWLERKKALNRKDRKRKLEDKPVVDTKASKGRKIKYVEIPKLVNFFPAMPERVPWSHEKRNELFKSLFE